MSLIVRKPWTSQPQVPGGIDWGNPITQGLVFATEASFGGRDIVSKANNNSLGSGVTVGQGINGRQWDFTGGQANQANNFGVWQGLSGATQATWDITIYFSAASPLTHFLGQWDSNLQWLLQASNGALVWVAADDNSGNRRRWDYVAALFPSSGWYRLTASWQGGANKVLIVNGVDKTSGLSVVNSTANNIGTDNTTDFLQIGMVNGGIALAGAVSGVRIWNRGLSFAECLSLNSNSNQVYAPLSRRLLLPAASVSVYRPNSDVQVAGWTGVPDNANKYANINEVSPSDANFVFSPVINGSQGSLIVGLDGTLAAGTWDVRYRADFTLGARQLRMSLLDGSNTVLGTGDWMPVQAAYAQYTSTIGINATASRLRVEVQ